MKVETMLKLERLLPHQRMLREKLLVPYDDAKMKGRVLFISRESAWSGRELRARITGKTVARHTMCTRCTAQTFYDRICGPSLSPVTPFTITNRPMDGARRCRCHWRAAADTAGCSVASHARRGGQGGEQLDPAAICARQLYRHREALEGSVAAYVYM